jgi:hypothetical protein
VNEGAVDAVLTASRTLIAVATKSLGAAAEETTIASGGFTWLATGHGQFGQQGHAAEPAS